MPTTKKKQPAAKSAGPGKRVARTVRASGKDGAAANKSANGRARTTPSKHHRAASNDANGGGHAGVLHMLDLGAINAGIEKAHDAIASFSHALAGTAAQVGQRADSAAKTVGSAMESTGHYLKDDDFSHVGSDVTDMVRRNPLPALLAGVGVGILLAHVSTSRRG